MNSTLEETTSHVDQVSDNQLDDTQNGKSQVGNSPKLEIAISKNNQPENLIKNENDTNINCIQKVVTGNVEHSIDYPSSGSDNFNEIDITDESKSQENFKNENHEVLPQEERGIMKRKSFSEWSRSTFTFAKQMVSESLGFSSKTVDKEIEKLITNLMESKLQCNKLILKAQNILKALSALSVADKDFGMFLSESSLKELADYKLEMACTGECFRYMNKSTSLLEGVLNMFIANLSTLSTKTMEDALLSVRQYDACRIEYDAYRTEHEQAIKLASGNEEKIKMAELKYNEHVIKYNKARADITVKIKLVEENKVKVIKRNLMVLHNALLKYSKDAIESLSDISSQYEFKPLSSDSWLEASD